MSENLTAWSQGYLAYQRGEGIMSNPYAKEPHASLHHKHEWQGGWNYADDEYRKLHPKQELQP